ncbi:SRPBCC family protein [Actinospica sp. MGRD01-02]|uniref:SRPBCC family protein n=1 Tax=Actinospica acidithermotolerans TaxID=2828514 RepID=A0A941ECC6_9ACTN|nr:SRPBCC family protein [Actinospica acidithermotolerans]MBR7828846.1 SRPBCC family protein [Actinospica acidithermotolerans]
MSIDLSPHQSEPGTTFRARAEILLNTTPEHAYAVVTDLARSGEWSAECTGGQWVLGEPAKVGSIFRGDNLRGTDVVAWAPVIRGRWNTEAEVIEAEPARVFRWVILNSERGRQESTWTYEFEPANDGAACRLVHSYRLGRLTEGLEKILTPLDEDARGRFVREWNAKIEADIRATVERIKTAVEKD